MSNRYHITSIIYEPDASILTPVNDNSDWANDLVSSYRVLREIRRRVLVRWFQCPSYRDAIWLTENLAFLQRIWRLLRDRDYRFTD